MYTKIKLIKWENMKKIIFFIVSLAILLTLAACNDDGTTNYSKEVYEAAYDELYNGNGKHEFSMRIVENDYEVNSNGIVDGYNIKINDYYYSEYYDYLILDIENKMCKGYYPTIVYKDDQQKTNGTYELQIDEFSENDCVIMKEQFVSSIISFAFLFTRDQYLAAYDTKTIEIDGVSMSFIVELDEDGNFKHITISGGGYIIETTYTWEPNVLVELEELDGFHVHTNECKTYEYKYGDYHKYYYDYGYGQRSDLGVSESCTYENDECIYCHHKKEEA